jgi:hypothetical protein
MRLIFGRRFFGRLPQLASDLHAHPHLGAGAESLAQADRELGGHGGATIDHARQSDTRDAESQSELSHRHAAIGAQHGIRKDGPGVRRVVHSSHSQASKKTLYG